MAPQATNDEAVKQPKPEPSPAEKAAADARAGTIRALKAEREGYERRGLEDRVKEVDEALEQLTADAKPRSRRQVTRG